MSANDSFKVEDVRVALEPFLRMRRDGQREWRRREGRRCERRPRLHFYCAALLTPLSPQPSHLQDAPLLRVVKGVVAG